MAPAANNAAPPPPSLSNETLRERILTGGGTGNARGSLTKVAARYAHFVRSLSCRGDGSDDRAAASAAALRTELLLHDLEMRKLILSSRASDGDAVRYSATLSEMREALAATRGDIESLTATLADERRAKRRREEYDALARMGNERNPPIRETRLELERVQREIEGVRGEVEEARWELTVRERQMRLFMASLGDLRSSLREEKLKKDDGVPSSPSTKGKKRKHMSDDGGDRSDQSNDHVGAL